MLFVLAVEDDLNLDTPSDLDRFDEFLEYLFTVGFTDEGAALRYSEFVAGNVLSTAAWTLIGVL